MIRITKQADYGILLLSLFAKVRGGRSYSARDLALETGLGLAMVARVLKLLVHAGLLVSHRGVRGGFELAKHPADIPVRSIIEALEGPISITSCATESPADCGVEHHCTVRTSWQRLNDAVREALDRVTLAEMTCPAADPVGAFARERTLAPPESV